MKLFLKSDNGIKNTANDVLVQVVRNTNIAFRLPIIVIQTLLE